MELTAKAKINLSLRILGKREDGYHELDTVMTQVGLADRLTLLPSKGKTSLQCNRTDLESADNLVLKAVRVLEARTGRPLPTRIHLEKNIPTGAGLGGGSSNAASTLRALNDLYQLGLNQGDLISAATELGSDVPFFLMDQPCRCRGRGERMEPLPDLPSFPLALFKLPFDIPTPWAYGAWAQAVEVPGFPYEIQLGPWGDMINDLERPVFAKYLILGSFKDWLLKQAEVAAALLSGSGSSLFAILKEEQLGPALVQRANERYGEQLWSQLTTSQASTCSTKHGHAP